MHSERVSGSEQHQHLKVTFEASVVEDEQPFAFGSQRADEFEETAFSQIQSFKQLVSYSRLGPDVSL